MRRKPQSTRSKVLEDRQYNSIKISKLINKIMQNGNKFRAEKIVYTSLINSSKETNNGEIIPFFDKIIENSAPKKNIVKRRKGGQTYSVPYEITEDQRFTKAIYFIVKNARKNARSKGVPITKSLTQLFIDTFNGTGAIVAEKESLHKLAEEQAAFSNFRW